MNTNKERTMRERPILFSGPMVRAILEGRKTQTRRVVKPSVRNCTVGAYSAGGVVEPVNVQEDGDPWDTIPCPYGQPGDRLWVRETHRYIYGPDGGDAVNYRADNDCWRRCGDRVVSAPGVYTSFDDRWFPSIHMPRWASRITLEITEVRVERLQQITCPGAIAEGVQHAAMRNGGAGAPEGSYANAFANLWDSNNGPGSWDANPWVWVVAFKRVQP